MKKQNPDEKNINDPAKKLQVLFSAITEVVLVVNSQGRYLEIAPTSPSLLYKPPEEIIGKTVYEIFSKEQADFFMQGITHTLDFSVATNIEYMLNIGGRDIFFEAKICPMSADTVLVVARDITERKMFENVLQKKEEIFRLMAENSGDMVSRRTPDGVYQYVSHSCKTVLGYEPEELIGHSSNDFIHPEDLASVIHANESTIKNGVTSRISYRIQKKDGVYIWLETISRACKDTKTGELSAITASSRDITMQKRIESALLQSESRYKDLFDNTNNCVAIYEARDNGNDFIIRGFNKAAEKIEKVNKSDIIGKSVLEVFPGVKEFGIFDVFRRVWETGKPENHPVSLYKDARISGWKENYVYKLHSGEIVAVYEDLTGRKKVEHDLEASETRYRRLFESSKDGILILNADTGMIDDVNPFLIDMLGYTKEDFVLKKIWEIGLFKDIVASKEAFAELQKKDYIRYEDLPLKTKDGRRIEVEFVSNVYPVDSVRVVQCNIRDITARKRAEAESESKYKAIFEASVDAMMILTPERGFFGGNPATLKMFRCKNEEEFVSKTPAGLSPEYQPDGALSTVKAQAMMAIAMEKGFHIFEWKHRRADGEEFFATVLLTRMALEGKEVLQATVRDIAQEKKTKLEMEKRIADLETFKQAVTGSEMKMAELKSKVAELEKKLAEWK